MTIEEFILKVEGKRNRVYKDSAGKKTIGVGHLLSLEEMNRSSVYLNGEYVSYQGGLSDEQVMKLLSQDLDVFRAAVSDAVKVEVSANQYTALLSFCFNVGIGAFQNSTLLKRVNQKDWERVPLEFIKWIHAGQKIDKGLINRRVKEIVMWLDKSME